MVAREASRMAMCFLHSPAPLYLCASQQDQALNKKSKDKNKNKDKDKDKNTDQNQNKNKKITRNSPPKKSQCILVANASVGLSQYYDHVIRKIDEDWGNEAILSPDDSSDEDVYDELLMNAETESKLIH